MTCVRGADGCAAGWICLTRDRSGRTIQSHLCTTVDALFAIEPAAQVLALDIPIGLADRGSRACDREARQLLGRRACCVFTPPVRPALAAANRVEASRISMESGGGGIACQTWGICPKIRDVDRALRRDAQMRSRVVEVHPELSFREWNGGVTILQPKKSRAGRERRLRLIARYFGRDAYGSVVDSYPRARVAQDDIIDAFAALWTAERVAEGNAKCLPTSPEVDAYGLTMQMWY